MAGKCIRLVLDGSKEDFSLMFFSQIGLDRSTFLYASKIIEKTIETVLESNKRNVDTLFWAINILRINHYLIEKAMKVGVWVETNQFREWSYQRRNFETLYSATQLVGRNPPLMIIFNQLL